MMSLPNYEHKWLQNQLCCAVQVPHLSDTKASSPKPLILLQSCSHDENLLINLD